jgi:hypothetical protein
MYDQAALHGQVFGKLCPREGYNIPITPYQGAVDTVIKDVIKPWQLELEEANFYKYCDVPIVMWARRAKWHDVNEVAFIVDDEQSFIWLQEWADFTWSDRTPMESNLSSKLGRRAADSKISRSQALRASGLPSGLPPSRLKSCTSGSSDFRKLIRFNACAHSWQRVGRRANPTSGGSNTHTNSNSCFLILLVWVTVHVWRRMASHAVPVNATLE